MAEEALQDSSTCGASWGGPKQAGDGHDNSHYGLVAVKDQPRVRAEEGVEIKKKQEDEGIEREHIWVKLQLEEPNVKMCEQSSEEASTASRSRGCKRLLEINTAAVTQDVPLHSAVRELVWDPLTISTGSFIWEKSIFEETYAGDETDDEDDDVPEMESCIKTHTKEKAQMGGGESCTSIDPILLAWVYKSSS